MPRQKQRTPELRDRVLSAAVDALMADGVAGLTARRVGGGAHTSTPAVYGLFGDKGGLVRAVFFEGFRMLHGLLERAVRAADRAAALRETIAALRAFLRDEAVLSQVMFGRPFADFDPGPDELAAGAAGRGFLIDRVPRAVQARGLAGGPAAIAHRLVRPGPGPARRG